MRIESTTDLSKESCGWDTQSLGGIIAAVTTLVMYLSTFLAGISSQVTTWSLIVNVKLLWKY